jgi:aspartyl-tRNA(Asn)/glutamyl-tRNA(Gln) amidotransferase subunit B
VPAKAAANWLMGEVARLARESRTPLPGSGLGLEGLASLIKLVEAGTINGSTAKELLEELYLAGGDPAAVVEERGLGQVSDQAELERLVDAVLAENPAAVADFQGGKEQALQRLVGGVMKATRGRADARVVTGLLRDRLAP